MKRFLPLSLLLHGLLLAAVASVWRPPTCEPATETIALELVTERPDAASHAQPAATALAVPAHGVASAARTTRTTHRAHSRRTNQPAHHTTPAAPADVTASLARTGGHPAAGADPARTPAHDGTETRAALTAERTGSAAGRVRAALSAEVQAYFSYPRRARLHGWQGTVRVGVRLSAAGHILQLRIVESSHHEVLDQAALDSLSRIHQVPGAVAWLAGHASDIVLPIEYRLTDG